MRLPSVLSELQKHAFLCEMDLETLSQYARLVSALKWDILLPQPLDQSNPDCAPKVLPPSIAAFLSEALRIPQKFIQDSWDILKDYLWETEVVGLTEGDYKVFKCFGWEKGLTAMALYPPEHKCMNTGCTNTKLLKKEKSVRAIVYTLANGAQPAWIVKLYCSSCKTDYHNNFLVHDGERAYYQGIPQYLEVGDHQFVEDRVAKMWITQMLMAWVSASNNAKLYQMNLAAEYLTDTEWQFVPRLMTEQVWIAFVCYSLLNDKMRYGNRLIVPHTGEQKDCFTQAMKERNMDMILHGQPDAISHACDKCFRTYKTENDEIRECHPIVGDGITLGRPCCSSFGCPEPLQNNRHRFCKTHKTMEKICVIDICKEPVSGVKSKTCASQEHKAIEAKNKEKGAAAFILRERYKKAELSHNVEPLETHEIQQSEDLDDPEEVDGAGHITAQQPANSGSVGAEDDSVAPSTELPKTKPGKQALKTQFGRRRTHNKQTLVRPCGIIYARATMMGTEAVSNFLKMVENAFSVPGARKPEHIFYDTNCLARQQAEGNPWFTGIGMCVDVWHFRNKHKVTHAYCQKHCNPIKYPELLDEFGKWFFNTSVAEQINAWLGGYLSIC
ncbi:hypothetical protein NLJ89_g10345 [Agrocybe chaxingu]|uniref:CxC5 like cysteine cluster associated with KDZ domain-containing protein n=1 Tax=Agrocybe chaxingu TaxID=84603 RepID=A0A9W8MQD2_9AGAR|nr:hypothetical protein NLJ89_g10345 [Agrocybe chaxingu]